MGKPTGFGKREYYTHKSEIEDLLSKQYTKIEVYKMLSKQGKITMSYQMLCVYLNSGKHLSVKKEFLEVIHDVKLMLYRGYTRRMIYEEMKSNGKITFSYDALCRKIREYDLNEISDEECLILSGVKKSVSNDVSEKVDTFANQNRCIKAAPRNISFNSHRGKAKENEDGI